MTAVPGGGEVATGRDQYLQTLASVTEMTRTQAERVARLLAKQGEVQSGQVSRVAEDLVRRTQKNREAVRRLIQREVKRQLGLLGMATRDEVARLQQRVRALEQAVERSSQPSGARSSAARGSSRTSTRARTGGAGPRSSAASPGTTRRGRGATAPEHGGGDAGQ
jgi:polyhydroxyalkanoate synthesis regulator phasin